MTSRYPGTQQALRRAADVLEQRPYLDPVAFLRECADELDEEDW